MPILGTLDLGRCRIQGIAEGDFANVPALHDLILPGNAISWMDENALPRKLQRLHLGRNQLTTLNGTLRELEDLEWLFINSNQLTTLEGELPLNGHKLMLLHAGNNSLDFLPQSFRKLNKLESVFFQHNLLSGVDGAFQKYRGLKRLLLTHNRIKMLSADEFYETENLEDLQMGHNLLPSLNGSLLPLKFLRTLNLTHNKFQEFSMQEFRGLVRLRVVDLSHNQIERLSGRMENLVEQEIRIVELHLEHNRLVYLDGALMGLHGLTRLHLSNNLLQKISPDDLIGLDDLKLMDVSHNKLTTLEETAKTFLPKLEELLASHNFLKILEHDFHGLPSLCWADLSYNEIKSISNDLVEHTKCPQGTLKIYLQDNPVLCDDRMPELIATMETQQAKMYGIGQCAAPEVIVPQVETLEFPPIPKVEAISADVIV